MKKIISLLTIAFLILSQHSFVKAVEEICEYDSVVYATMDELGENLAYIVEKDNNFFIVHNWEEGKKYNKIRNLQLSNKGNKISYLWKNQSEYSIVYNWREQTVVVEDIYDFKVSEDGKNMSFIGLDDSWEIYIIYNWEEELISGYDMIFNLEVSNNWKDMFYIVVDEWKRFIVHNWEKVGKEYDSIATLFKVSEDSEDIFFIAIDKWKTFIVHNWEEIGKEYDSISDIVVSRNKNSIFYSAKKEWELFRIHHSQEKKSIYQLLKKWEKNVLIQNGIEGQKYDMIYNLSISDDWKNVYYIARDSITGLSFVVHNWIEGEKYDDIGHMKISPNGKDIYYVAKKRFNNTKEWVKSIIVHNTEEIKEYKGTWIIDELMFSTNWANTLSKTWEDTYFYNNIDLRLCNWEQINFWNERIIKQEDIRTISNDITSENKNIDKSASFKKVILSRRNLKRDTSTIKYVSQIDRLVENMNDFWKIETILKKLYQVESKLKWKTDKTSIRLIDIVDYLVWKMELKLIDNQ